MACSQKGSLPDLWSWLALSRVEFTGGTRNQNSPHSRASPMLVMHTLGRQGGGMEHYLRR